MKFSIVIPSYQRHQVLDANLFHMVHSDFPKDEYEVIICDAWSAHGSEIYEVSQKYQDGLNLIYIDLGRDKGWRNPSPHRNRGFREASGEVVLMLDVDYIMSETALHALNKDFFGDQPLRREDFESVHMGGSSNSPRDPDIDREKLVVRGKVDNFTVARQQQLSAQDEKWKLRPYRELLKLVDRPGKGGNIYLWAAKKSLVESIGGYDERLTQYGREDDDIALRLQRAGGISYRNRDFAVVTFDHNTAGPDGRRDCSYNDAIVKQSTRDNITVWPRSENWGIIETSSVKIDYRSK